MKEMPKDDLLCAQPCAAFAFACHGEICLRVPGIFEVLASVERVEGRLDLRSHRGLGPDRHRQKLKNAQRKTIRQQLGNFELPARLAWLPGPA